VLSGRTNSVIINQLFLHGCDSIYGKTEQGVTKMFAVDVQEQQISELQALIRR